MTSEIKMGVIYFYDDNENLKDILDSILTDKKYRDESLLILRRKNGSSIQNSDVDPKKIVQTNKHVVTKIFNSDGECVEGLVKITSEPSTPITYEKLMKEDENNKDWRESVEQMAAGQVESFSYAINNLDIAYVNKLELNGVLDIRDYGGIITEYFPKDYKKYPEEFDGTLIPTVYYGPQGSSFVFHVEDYSWSSLNLCAKGCKLWFFLASRDDTFPASKHLNKLAGDACRYPWNRKVYFPSPKMLQDAGFPVKFLLQKEGDIVVTKSHAPHFGFNVKPCINIAKNYCEPKEWPEVLMQLKNCPSSNSDCNSPCHQGLNQPHLYKMKKFYRNFLKVKLGIEGISQGIKVMSLATPKKEKSAASSKNSLQKKNVKRLKKRKQSKKTCYNCGKMFSCRRNLNNHRLKNQDGICLIRKQ